MKKPQLAIAYYDEPSGDRNATVYVSLDGCSDREFRKYCKQNYGYDVEPENFDVYPIGKSYEPDDIDGKVYNITLEVKPDDDDDVCPHCASKKFRRNSSGEIQCDNCGFSETE